jgi:hypothetical protein
VELRAYFFGNMYLSSIQQGIQAAHVVADIFTQYRPGDNQAADMLYDWAENHKTMILLNGGYGSELHRLYETFSSPENPYPFAAFRESAEALDGAMTSVGIVLPEYVWIGAKQIREGWIEEGRIARSGKVSYSDWNNGMKDVSYDITKWEFENLICQLNNYGLAK